jgi:hypothetical protein
MLVFEICSDLAGRLATAPARARQAPRRGWLRARQITAVLAVLVAFPAGASAAPTSAAAQTRVCPGVFFPGVAKTQVQVTTPKHRRLSCSQARKPIKVHIKSRSHDSLPGWSCKGGSGYAAHSVVVVCRNRHKRARSTLIALTPDVPSAYDHS